MTDNDFLSEGLILQNGRYSVSAVLGKGGFGITYLAEQTGLARKVAIKEFFVEKYCSRSADGRSVYVGASGSIEMVERCRNRFIKEARHLASLKHKSIVPVIDIFEENGTAYYVMEFLDGGSLSDVVGRAGFLDEQKAIGYIKDVANALAYLHDRKMMHLDVKPTNILLDSFGTAVLIDFGLSKQYDEKGAPTSMFFAGVSQGYSPLEQYNENGVVSFSPETDIYALGATLYKMVTGITPPEAVELLGSGELVYPHYVSEPTKNAIGMAMKPRRRERPHSIAEFMAYLNGDGMSVQQTGGASAGVVKEIIIPVSTEDGGNLEQKEGKAATHKVISFSEDSVANPPFPPTSSKKEVVASSSGVQLSEVTIANPPVRTTSSQKDVVASSSGVQLSDDTIANPSVPPTSSKKEVVASSSGLQLSEDTVANPSVPPTSSKKEVVASSSGVQLSEETRMNDGGESRGVVVSEGVKVAGSGEAATKLLYKENDKGGSKLGLWIAVVVLSLIIVVGALFVLISGSGDDGEFVVGGSAIAVVPEQETVYESPVVADSLKQETDETMTADSCAVQIEKNVAVSESLPGTVYASESKPEQEIIPEPKPKPEPVKESKPVSKPSVNSYEANLKKGISTSKMVDLGLRSGVKWAGYNFGATSPESRGNFYSWGESRVKSFFGENNYSGGNGWSSDIVKSSWGGSWRIPTKDDLRDLYYYCKWERYEYRGVSGFRVIGPNGNSIFIPVTGHYEDDMLWEGEATYFWSSTKYNDDNAYYMKVDGENGLKLKYGQKWVGMTIRPVCD